MKVHLVDGTYELFRAYFAMPPSTAPDGRPVGAVRGLIQTLLLLLRQEDVSHVACAFDHVVESFRNRLFDGYKTGAGVPEDLRVQFDLAERAASALGLVVWPMTEFEADDALATAARRWRDEPTVDQMVICSPDKDLAQAVWNGRVVCLDRRRGSLLDAAGVRKKFGVAPESIPDYLALVGDAADGIPGVPGWGAKTSSLLLSRFDRVEDIPPDPSRWPAGVRGARSLAAVLATHLQDVELYKRLATLILDVPLEEELADLEWTGVQRQRFESLCDELGFERLKGQPLVWDEA